MKRLFLILPLLALAAGAGAWVFHKRAGRTVSPKAGPDDAEPLPAWRLALPPRKGVILRKTKKPGWSKLGGDPFLPDGVEWPREPSGGEMSFLAQIRCEDLPRDLGFPETGALFFFLDQADFDWEPEEDTGHLHSRVIYAEGPLPSAPRRRTTPDPEPTPEAFVRAEPVLCRPDDCRTSYGLGRPKPTENVLIKDCTVSGYDPGTVYYGTYGTTITAAPAPSAATAAKSSALKTSNNSPTTAWLKTWRSSAA